MARHSTHYRRAWLFMAVLALVSCGGDDGEIREITKSRELPGPRMFKPETPSTMERLGFRAPAPKQPQTTRRNAGYDWTLPDGWEEIEPSQFRQGNWRVNGEPDVQAYLTVLPGTGGGILGNINRWRNQMGLAPVELEEVTSGPKLDVLGQKALFVELDGTFAGMGGGSKGEGYRMIGVLVAQHQGACVTLKLVGPAAKVEKAKPPFIDLCRSLTPKAAMPAGHGAGNGHASSSSGLKYALPKGWRTAEPRPFREINLLPTGGTDTECYVTVLSGTAGGVDANINRWQRQMNQPALTAEQIKALPTIKMFNRDAKVVEITGTYGGMGGGGKGGHMMIATILAMPNALLTVKMTGPEATVKAKKNDFLAFCKSLHI